MENSLCAYCQGKLDTRLALLRNTEYVIFASKIVGKKDMEVKHMEATNTGKNSHSRVKESTKYYNEEHK